MVRKGQWHDYGNGKKEYGGFVRKAREIVYSQPALSIYYNSGPKGGKPDGNNNMAVLICLLLKIWIGKPYRELASVLADSTYLWSIMRLRVLPGRMDR